MNFDIMEEILFCGEEPCVDVLEAFLRAGLPADWVLEDGHSLLTAVIYGLRHQLEAQERFIDLEEIRRLVERLLKYGADLNRGDRFGIEADTFLVVLMDGYPVIYTEQGVQLV